MKKIIALVLALTMCMTLSACGKSKAAKAAEDAIAAIGEVTSESGDLIANAEKLYNILTDSEKSEVENRLTLVEAKEAFTEIQSEIVYKNAKDAYEQLKDVANMCVEGMDTIYGAWYFGIYEASDTSTSSFFIKMSLKVPGFSSDELESAAKNLGISASSASNKNNWQASILIAEEAISARGDYDTIAEKMDSAEKTLQSLTDDYDDYTYYPKLKEYYAAIKSYVDFFTSPTGSFEQLKDTINSYENSIRTLESDVSFLFNK